MLDTLERLACRPTDRERETRCEKKAGPTGFYHALPGSEMKDNYWTDVILQRFKDILCLSS